MKIELTIQNSHVLIILLFLTAASAIGLVAGYGGTAPATMGHTWGEMECAGCITTANLADSSVTGAKIADGTITTADVASIDGSKITGMVSNSDMVDGKHASDFIPSGMSITYNSTGTTCPTGGIVLKKFSARTCNSDPGCGPSCTIPAGWSVSPPTCAYYTVGCYMYTDSWGNPVQVCECGANVCTASVYTEVICMGN